MIDGQKEGVVDELEKDSKVIDISGEPVRVYPSHCVNHGNCFNCQYVMGKILCEPRHCIAPMLTRTQKIDIARDAKARGVKQVADEQRMPMHIFRAWVSAYARESTHYQSLLLHYENVRDAEVNGFGYQPAGEVNNDQ